MSKDRVSETQDTREEANNRRLKTKLVGHEGKSGCSGRGGGGGEDHEKRK